MILLDSSGWLEIFLDGPLARQCTKHLERSKQWIVSAINIFEVYRKLAKSSEGEALQAIAVMRHGQLIPVDETISLTAADLALQYDLAMADSLILATAYTHKATLVTRDNDFAKLPQCVVIR